MYKASSSRAIYPYIALGFGLLTLAFSAIFVRLADSAGTVTAFYRMAIATLLVAPAVAYHLRRQQVAIPRRGVWLAVLGGVFFSLDLSLWTTGITLSGATNPTLLANTAPLWVGLGSMLLFGERQKATFWLGLGLALVGAATILREDALRAFDFGLGTLLGLLAGVFYAGYYLATQRGRALLNTLSYFWISVLTATLLLLALNLVLGHPLTGYDQATYLNFLGLGVLVQVAGWLAVNYAQGYLPASLVAPTLLGQPILTALLASVVLGETFSAWHLVGGATVLTGVYLVHRSRNRSHNRNRDRSLWDRLRLRLRLRE